MTKKKKGFSGKFPSYGDEEFSKYLRTVFLKSINLCHGFPAAHRVAQLNAECLFLAHSRHSEPLS
jgi:hypothetical protein